MSEKQPGTAVDLHWLAAGGDVWTEASEQGGKARHFIPVFSSEARAREFLEAEPPRPSLRTGEVPAWEPRRVQWHHYFAVLQLAVNAELETGRQTTVAMDPKPGKPREHDPSSVRLLLSAFHVGAQRKG